MVACCSVVGSSAPIFTTTPTMEAEKGNFSALSSEAKQISELKLRSEAILRTSVHHELWTLNALHLKLLLCALKRGGSYVKSL